MWVRSPQSAVRSPQSAVRSPQSTVHSPQFTVLTLHWLGIFVRQVQKLDRTTRTRTSPGRINSDLPGSTRTEVKFDSFWRRKSPQFIQSDVKFVRWSSRHVVFLVKGLSRVKWFTRTRNTEIRGRGYFVSHWVGHTHSLHTLLLLFHTTDQQDINFGVVYHFLIISVGAGLRSWRSMKVWSYRLTRRFW